MSTTTGTTTATTAQMSSSNPTNDRAATSILVPATTLARLVVLLLGGVVIGVGAGGIFDEFQWSLAIAPLAPTVAFALLGLRHVALRALGAVLAVLTSVAIAVFAADGSGSAIGAALAAGPQRLLSTEWPSPVRGDLVGAVALLIAVAVVVSDALALRDRWHLAPLAPLAVAAVVVVALSAPIGVRWAFLGSFAAVAIVFALMRDDDSLQHRLQLLRGERRLAPMLLAAVFVTGLASIPVALEARADPRRTDAAEQTAPLLDPIEAASALRALDPPIGIHEVELASTDAAPLLWRTAALDTYDGVRWSPDLTVRPIGKTLGPAVEPSVDYAISVLDDDTSLLPFPGSPISVDASVETDADRTIVRLVDRPIVGDPIAASATLPPTLDDALAVGLGVRPIDDLAAGLTELAQTLGGDGTVAEQLRRIESTMRNDWDLDSEVQGGGLQQVLIDRFLRDTQRGNTEQFAGGFALLARSLGVDARVATGFLVGPPTASTFVIGSDTAAVWPEIRLDDGRWLAFAPVPLDEVSGGTPPPPEPQVQTPAAPQPPIPPPPEPTSDPADAEDDAEAAPRSTLSTVVTWVARTAAIGGIVALPFLIAAGLILGVKARRRKRRLNAPTAAERIRGAWATATDALVDAGLSIGTSSTDAEIARAGAPMVAGAPGDLRRLATLATTATFGAPPHPELLADDAVACLATVEATMIESRSWWWRLRWRLSVRSLRSESRSPVTD